MNTKSDYIICRCEDVALQDIEELIQRTEGEVSSDEIKRRLRPGMGWCQARICGTSLADLAGSSGMPSRSTVVRPVPLSEVAGLEA